MYKQTFSDLRGSQNSEFHRPAVGVYATEPPVSSEGAPPELSFALERILCILRGYQRALMNADERVKWAKRRTDGRTTAQTKM